MSKKRKASRTANAPAPPTAAPVLNTAPAFDADQVALQRRMRFNPLRMLTPEMLSMALDQFDIGILRHAALLWDAMMRRDDTLSFVVPQLENSIAGKPWGVFKKKGANPIEAARHAAALEYFYGSVTAVNAFDRNERGDRHLLLKQMSSAYAYRYAVHHFVWRPEPGKMIQVEGAAPVPALSAEMEFVPLWYFETTTGSLRFLPFGGFGVTGQPMDFQGEWMCTSGPGMMFAASICYVFKRLTFQDWTIFNERYSQQKVVGQTPESKDSPAGAAMADMVANFNGDQGIVLYGSQPGSEPPIKLLGPSGTVSVDLFERFLDRQDRKMTVMFRGSDLRNMSREKDATGVSAQTEETEALELAHCASIASACREFIDRAVIRYCFGEGVEPLAHFGLPDMDKEDAQQLRESAGFLADRGVLVDAATVAERLGVTTTEEEEDALGNSGGRKAEGGEQEACRGRGPRTEDDPEEPGRTENAAARLEQLITQALRTGNFDPNQPRNAEGKWTSGPRTITTSRGAQMQATDWFINANQRLALTITTPDNKSLNVEETAPGEFRDFSGKGVFRSTDPALDDLRNAALAESKRRKGEAEKPAPESSRLSWGSGRGFGIVRIGGELVPESFLAAHLQKRGIDVTTDWDAAHTQSAVVPPEIEAEIAEAWKKRERPAPAPKQEIQLWEPCERCGREPSYQTPRGHLCAQCKS